MSNPDHLARSVSIGSKFGVGVALPMVMFVMYQVALIESTRGSGGWEGMGIAFGSIVLAPGLLIANCWVLLWTWRRWLTPFLLGLMLPGLIGALEYCLIRGESSGARASIKAAFVAPYVELWLSATLVFTPLLVSIVMAIARKRTRRQ